MQLLNKYRRLMWTIEEYQKRFRLARHVMEGKPLAYGLLFKDGSLIASRDTTIVQCRFEGFQSANEYRVAYRLSKEDLEEMLDNGTAATMRMDDGTTSD